MPDDKKPDPTLVEDAKGFKDGVNKIAEGAKDAAKAADKFFTDGNNRVIGPAATKALVQGKKLVNRVVEKLFKRDDEA